ncbi:hypothetical protein XCR_2900 [Xanthomonas campestris pv. raphani 756C]|nr:hypothetical protein XCR_2900 [Xanthomonas campestris pv. raphani 756C]
MVLGQFGRHRQLQARLFGAVRVQPQQRVRVLLKFLATSRVTGHPIARQGNLRAGWLLACQLCQQALGLGIFHAPQMPLCTLPAVVRLRHRVVLHESRAGLPHQHQQRTEQRATHQPTGMRIEANALIIAPEQVVELPAQPQRQQQDRRTPHIVEYHEKPVEKAHPPAAPDHTERAHQRRDCARGAQPATGLAPPPPQAHRARPKPAEQVQQQEPATADRPFQQRAQRQQEHHVAQQMVQVTMQEGGRQHALRRPFRTALDVAQGEHLGQPRIVGRTQRVPVASLRIVVEQASAAQGIGKRHIVHGQLRQVGHPLPRWHLVPLRLARRTHLRIALCQVARVRLALQRAQAGLHVIAHRIGDEAVVLALVPHMDHDIEQHQQQRDPGNVLARPGFMQRHDQHGRRPCPKPQSFAGRMRMRKRAMRASIAPPSCPVGRP